MQSLNVHHASYCSSMLTTSNWASLGEPLQTLSELVDVSFREPHQTLSELVGASGSEPHTSGKARLPVVEYYEFGPRSESGIPSIRLPS